MSDLDVPQRAAYGSIAEALKTLEKKGDSVLIESSCEQPAFHTAARRLGMKVSYRRQSKNVYRVWLIAKGEIDV